MPRPLPPSQTAQQDQPVSPSRLRQLIDSNHLRLNAIRQALAESRPSAQIEPSRQNRSRTPEQHEPEQNASRSEVLVQVVPSSDEIQSEPVQNHEQNELDSAQQDFSNQTIPWKKIIVRMLWFVYISAVFSLPPLAITLAATDSKFNRQWTAITLAVMSSLYAISYLYVLCEDCMSLGFLRTLGKSVDFTDADDNFIKFFRFMFLLLTIPDAYFGIEAWYWGEWSEADVHTVVSIVWFSLCLIPATILALIIACAIIIGNVQSDRRN